MLGRSHCDQQYVRPGAVDRVDDGACVGGVEIAVHRASHPEPRVARGHRCCSGLGQARSGAQQEQLESIAGRCTAQLREQVGSVHVSGHLLPEHPRSDAYAAPVREHAVGSLQHAPVSRIALRRIDAVRVRKCSQGLSAGKGPAAQP